MYSKQFVIFNHDISLHSTDLHVHRKKSNIVNILSSYYHYTKTKIHTHTNIILHTAYTHDKYNDNDNDNDNEWLYLESWKTVFVHKNYHGYYCDISILTLGYT